MSLFFSYEVLPEGKDHGVSTVSMAWCDVDSLLAVAYSSKHVRFYQSAGELLPDVISKSSSN